MLLLHVFHVLLWSVENLGISVSQTSHLLLQDDFVEVIPLFTESVEARASASAPSSAKPGKPQNAFAPFQYHDVHEDILAMIRMSNGLSSLDVAFHASSSVCEKLNTLPSPCDAVLILPPTSR